MSTETPAMHRASVPLITTLSNLFRRSERAASRHRMQRAARIYAGKQTFWDKLVTYPDKGWALMILIGVAFVFTGVGYAACLVAESAVS